MTGYGSLRIFTACTGLCLSNKTSPNDWIFDPTEWFPVIRPVKKVDNIKGGSKANGKSNGAKATNGDEKTAKSVPTLKSEKSDL